MGSLSLLLKVWLYGIHFQGCSPAALPICTVRFPMSLCPRHCLFPVHALMLCLPAGHALSCSLLLFPLCCALASIPCCARHQQAARACFSRALLPFLTCSFYNLSSSWLSEKSFIKNPSKTPVRAVIQSLVIWSVTGGLITLSCNSN